MIKYGWRDSSSQALEEEKRERGFAQRQDIQTWFEFHDAAVTVLLPLHSEITR